MLPVQGLLWVYGAGSLDSEVALVQIVDQENFRWYYYRSDGDILRGGLQRKYYLHHSRTYLFPEEWL